MDVVAGPRRGKPVKSRVANFSKRKRNSTFEAFLAVGRNRLCMGYSGRSFAVEGSRRSKPVKSRVSKLSGVKVGWCSIDANERSQANIWSKGL